MPIINEYDAFTDQNVETEVTTAELAARVGDAPIVSFEEVIAEQEALKASALAKLAALGLTAEEASALL